MQRRLGLHFKEAVSLLTPNHFLRVVVWDSLRIDTYLTHSKEALSKPPDYMKRVSNMSLDVHQLQPQETKQKAID